MLEVVRVRVPVRVADIVDVLVEMLVAELVAVVALLVVEVDDAEEVLDKVDTEDAVMVDDADGDADVDCDEDSENIEEIGSEGMLETRRNYRRAAVQHLRDAVLEKLLEGATEDDSDPAEQHIRSSLVKIRSDRNIGKLLT